MSVLGWIGKDESSMIYQSANFTSSLLMYLFFFKLPMELVNLSNYVSGNWIQLPLPPQNHVQIAVCAVFVHVTE